MVKICKDGRVWGQNNSYDKTGYKKKMSRILLLRNCNKVAVKNIKGKRA